MLRRSSRLPASFRKRLPGRARRIEWKWVRSQRSARALAYGQRPLRPLVSEQRRERVEVSVKKLHLGSGDRIIPGFVNVDMRDMPGVDISGFDVADLSRFEA